MACYGAGSGPFITWEQDVLGNFCLYLLPPHKGMVFAEGYFSGCGSQGRWSESALQRPAGENKVDAKLEVQ